MITKLSRALIATLALLWASPILSAQEAPKATSLFDGKTLEGWEFTKGVWRVEDGAITAGSYQKKFPRNEFVSTKKSYANFELKLKIKCSGDPKTGLINSGIQIRSAKDGKGVAGYQIDCGAGWFGKIYDEHRRALIYPEPLDAAALEKAVDVFGWNEYRILADGPRIQVWINGVKVTDYTETNPQIPLNGIIAPQIHGGGHVVVQFKDVTIRELPPTADAPTWESLGGVQAALAKVRKPRPRAPALKKIPTPPKGKDRVTFDFESGDLQGWRTVKGKLGLAVAANKTLRNAAVAMNQEGEHYLGTLEQWQGSPPSDLQTAVLESPVFKLEGADISLAVSGGRGPDTYIALCTLDGKEVRKSRGKNSEIFSPHQWTVPELVGKSVFVRLVDRSQGAWGHIVVDAISAKGTLQPEITAKRFEKLPPEPKPQKPPVQREGANSPQEELESFTLADGFVAELVASEAQGLINPIDLTFDDAGRLWTQTARMYPLDPVTGIGFGQAMKMMRDKKAMAKNPRFAEVKRLYELKDKGTDQILIIGDPTVEQKGQLPVFADGLTIPQSILPYKNGAWVAHGSELFFLNDSNGDGKSDKMIPVLSGFGFFDTHTMAHSLVRAPGGWIHFSHGLINSGDVTAVASGETTKIELCLTARFSHDGKKLEVLTRGLQNIWGYQQRGNGQWWGTEANDVGYSVIPMESQTTYKGVQNPKIRPYQPEFPPPHKFRVGGTGISGLAFSEDEDGVGFPEEWKDVAFLANPITNTINAVKVVRRADGSIESEHLPDLLKSTDKWFRPVNIEFGPDGCLYVADWYNKIVSHNEVDTAHPDRDKSHGRIWRIRHVSQKPRKAPDLIAAETGELVAHLSSPYVSEKRAAWHQLVDRKAVGQISALNELVADSSASSITRIHALWALEGLGGFEKELFVKLIADPDDNLSRETIRSLNSFSLSPSEIAGLVASRLEDSNPMLRSQVLRTLAEINQADQSVIDLLVRACKPDMPGQNLGGPYERKFERFLARKALEQYVGELKTYLDSDLARNVSAGKVLWAIQALDEEAKQRAFLEIWNKVSEQSIDGETFIAIAGMLNNPQVFKAVQPMFQNPAKAENLVAQALANQSRVQSRKLTEMLKPLVGQLLEKPETMALGLNAVSRFRIATLAPKVAAIALPVEDSDLLRQLLAAQSVNPKLNAASFVKIANNESYPFDLRAEAAHALVPVDQKTAHGLTKSLLTAGDANEKAQLASLFSQSKAGGLVLCAMVGQKVISPGVFDLSAAERIIQSHPRSPDARAIIASARKRVAEQRKQAQKRIHHLKSYIEENPGDPKKGKLTFASCLTCHKVGNEGQDIAPPLDGSGHRDLEHLLTAIVDPDAAVEGGYGLYRVTKTNGSVVEGFLDKKEALGTTVAIMGGSRIFVPQAEIKNQSFVGGRSFMLAAFGGLPEETMADLVAYISTLKEGEPPANSAPKKQSAVKPKPGSQPNFVVILTDDQGYGDLSCYGGKHIDTPRIDQMAKEGAKLTSFYVAAPVCTPSRAGLMTGCYPKRINMATGSNFGVLLAGDKKGLNPDEITIAEVLKGAGYKTGMFGKWHLGDQPEFMPTRQGFDEFFGIPYSHDIHPFHPRQNHYNFPPLALLDGEKVIEMDPDADFLTKRFTERAVKFIEKNKDEPFFLYVPHPIPHAPLHVSPPFMKGVAEEVVAKLAEENGNIDYRTRDQLFRQAIAEIDWSVGQILDALKANGIDENTLVLFTSDNGPPKNTIFASPGILRGNKGSTLEGGMREPTVIRWPSKIPAGKDNDEIMTAMDLLPTFAKLAGAEIPSDRVIDGKDISATLTDKAKTPHDKFFYHRANALQAVRSGKWKLHWNKRRPTQLYNLETDIGERKNLIKAEPDVVKRLTGYLKAFEKEIAANSRPAGFVENPIPLSIE